MEINNSKYLQTKEELEELTVKILKFAENYKNDPLALVTILSQIESLHREIRTEMFEKCLPDTRHHLYLLLKHIDEIGGWPYIERMRLQNICDQLIVTNNQKNEL
jgi:hypothetical protein